MSRAKNTVVSDFRNFENFEKFPKFLTFFKEFPIKFKIFNNKKRTC